MYAPQSDSITDVRMAVEPSILSDSLSHSHTPGKHRKTQNNKKTVQNTVHGSFL